MKKQNAGVWLGGIVFIFGIVIFIQSLSLDYHSKLGPGPGLLPRWLSGALVLLTLQYIIISIKKERITFEKILPKRKGARKILLILSSMAGFILIIPYTGFIIAGTLLLSVLLIDAYKWYHNLLISIGTSVILFLVFGIFLGVPLPVNYLGF